MDRYPQQPERIVGREVRPVAPRETGTSVRKPKPSKKLWWIIAGAVVLIVAFCVLGRYLWVGGSQVDASKYQAVFLSNGQVYFGKLHAYYTDHPYLTDVYYIQSNSTDGSTENSTTTNSNQQLIKLGGEIHAPEDEMILNKQSILFVENLTSGSKVVKLIQDGLKK